MPNPQGIILVTGATGYIGGRLIPHLLEKGWHIRAAGRSLEKLSCRPWSHHPHVELIEVDIMNEASLALAAKGCRAAFYLVHSMLPGQKDFEAADRVAATNMKIAAQDAGLEKIIYLSGLGDEKKQLSKHLASRTEVAHILQSGKTPVTVLRAAMIIGSGSASFEILRYLVDRLPVMITPRWLETPNQPIAVRNVIEYLSGCLEKDETTGKTFDIGGTDILTYRKLMEIYAEEAGLRKRVMIPVPVLTPRLSSYWIHIVTPVSASLARPLAEGLRYPVVCLENKIREIIPQKLLSCREAFHLALQVQQSDQIPSHWTDAGLIPPVESAQKGDAKWAGGTLFCDECTEITSADLDAVWYAIVSIGGKTGWYHADWLWELRGFLDRIFGGVGIRRGRRHPHELRVGDALDFWRVADLREKEKLVLAAEMKLPGKASLEFLIEKTDQGQVLVKQTARFRPKGLLGILYWYLVAPFHRFIFPGMLRSLVRHAETLKRPKKV